jgi:hypothetical protein
LLYYKLETNAESNPEGLSSLLKVLPTAPITITTITTTTITTTTTTTIFTHHHHHHHHHHRHTQVMTQLSDAPKYFIAKLSFSPVHAELATRGRHLRAQRPLYWKQQQAAVAAHWPTMPDVLSSIITEYAEPTPEDMW